MPKVHMSSMSSKSKHDPTWVLSNDPKRNRWPLDTLDCWTKLSLVETKNSWALWWSMLDDRCFYVNYQSRWCKPKSQDVSTPKMTCQEEHHDHKLQQQPQTQTQLNIFQLRPATHSTCQEPGAALDGGLLDHPRASSLTLLINIWPMFAMVHDVWWCLIMDGHWWSVVVNLYREQWPTKKMNLATVWCQCFTDHWFTCGEFT